MRRWMELTIPIVVAVCWVVLAVATLQGIGELSVAVIGPSPAKYGPPVEITPSEPTTASRQTLHVPGAPDGRIG